MGTTTRPNVKARSRLGNWMPQKEQVAADVRLQIAAAARGTPLANVVLELADLVRGDTVPRMNLSRAIDEALRAGFRLGYGNIDQLMTIVDYLTTYAPPLDASVPIATPLNLVLDRPMCMPSGYAVFRDPFFNAQLRNVLSYWCSFVSGPHSRTYLNTQPPHGWFSQRAQETTHLDDYLCERSQPYWGFASWNDFFTRRLREGARPYVRTAPALPRRRFRPQGQFAARARCCLTGAGT
ncbi:phophatidylserine decarboxylase associated domain-containing protein [Paraburkholderia lycopersici]|uniref:Phosphatidylserine decarboxylase n=1 Tax=Paraburkholderia lycopersici TaxID=416944 RepID=A0A1G7CDM8_9BURK|nr:phophatidylserine decarboxylase associated domain-containing protein [Paraburkholderia lycopersici]SDE36796.1 phosphatidylserine decarboxylase [Paraburkholderia lycopersici]